MISPLNRAACIIHPNLFGKDAWRGVPWEKLSAAATRMIMSKIDGSPATRNKALAALKGVARSAWELRLLDTEELMRIQSIKGDSGSRELAGRYVPTGELRDLLKVCAHDSSPAGLRDTAMISIAAATGARRAEIASIKMKDIKHPEKERTSIRVIGKRNKERTLHIVGNAHHALSDWICNRLQNPDGALFCMIRKSGEIIPDKEISPTALDKILRKRCAQAGLTDLDWHDLRRSATSDLLDAGADIATVAGILGHSSIQTTTRYDRRGEQAQIKASELRSIPYIQRKNFPPESKSHEKPPQTPDI